jgi:general stress protein 26
VDLKVHRYLRAARSYDRGMSRLAWCLIAALLLAPAPLWAQAPPPPSRDAILQAARTIITNARYANLVTAGGDRSFSARIVDPFPPEGQFTIWFATNAASRKVTEIRRNPRVTMLYFDAANKGYVSVKGTARLVTTPAEKSARWKDDWNGMYTNKNQGSDYVLVRVDVLTMEVVSVALGMINDSLTWKPVTLKIR